METPAPATTTGRQAGVLYCSAEIAGHTTPALIDSGASTTAVSLKFFQRLPPNVRNKATPPGDQRYTAISGTRIGYHGRVVLHVRIAGKSYKVDAAIMDLPQNNLMLGIDFLGQHGGVLDVLSATLYLGDRVVPLSRRPRPFPIIARIAREVEVPAKGNARVHLRHDKGAPTRKPCLFAYAPSPAVRKEYGALIVDDALISPDSKGRASILVTNASDKPFTLGTEVVLGHTAALTVSSRRKARYVHPHVPGRPAGDEDQDQASAEDHGSSQESDDTVQDSETAHLVLPELPGIPPDERDQIIRLLRRNQDVFARPGDTVQPTRRVVCHIKTGDHPPIALRPYRTALHHRGLVDKHVDEMLAAGVIQPSDSPWAFPIVMVPKKNGEVRFCVDYRRFNEITERDPFPMPNIEEVLASLHGAKFFTTLDLKSGFWQVPVAEEDQPKTAFITHRGVFTWKNMPFGLRNGSAVFQRLMNRVLDGLQHRFAFPYIDDIIIYSRTLAEHRRHLQEVFNRLRKDGLRLNAKK